MQYADENYLLTIGPFEQNPDWGSGSTYYQGRIDSTISPDAYTFDFRQDVKPPTAAIHERLEDFARI